MADYLQFGVRLLHIFFGMAWVGGLVLFSHAVGGGLKNAPPNVRGPAMLAIGEKVVSFFAVAAPLTILFGVWNQYLIAGTLSFQGDLWNVSLGGSLIVSLVMLGLAFGVAIPSFRKLKAMAPKGPPAPGAPPPAPSPEFVATQKRMQMAGMANLGLGTVAVVLMVVAVLARQGVL